MLECEPVRKTSDFFVKDADRALTMLLEALIQMADRVLKFADGFFREVLGLNAVLGHLGNLIVSFVALNELMKNSDGSAILADLKKQSGLFFPAHRVSSARTPVRRADTDTDILATLPAVDPFRKWRVPENAGFSPPIHPFRQDTRYQRVVRDSAGFFLVKLTKAQIMPLKGASPTPACKLGKFLLWNSQHFRDNWHRIHR
jgi:hypothetical protein